jgi:hypothetical protein
MSRMQVLSDSAGQMRRTVPGFDCTLRDGGFDSAMVRVVGELDMATARCSSRRCAGQRSGRGLCSTSANLRPWTVPG